MLNFISARWQTLKTKYKKFIPFIFTFIFCFSPLSVSAAEVSPDSKNEWFLLPFNEFRNVSGTFSESSGTYNATGYSGSVNGWGNSFTCSDVGGVFPTFKVGHKYLIYLTLTASTSNSDVSVNSFGLRLSGESDTVIWPVTISRTLNYFDSTFTLVQFSEYTPSVDRVLSTSSVMSLEFISTASYTNRLSWGIYALDITDNTDSEINQIVAAINNQTDKIVNGNDSTGGIVSQFQSNLNEFNSVINQFDDIENGFITDFTTSNEEIKDTLSDYTFTGNLLTCANWVTNRYMDFFDNSGDFKQYFIYPLIMGIALFFIGRGQSILGNLYRKPTESTTVTYSDSSGYKLNKDGSWTRSGSKGSTTTTTYRNGGKLRK